MNKNTKLIALAGILGIGLMGAGFIANAQSVSTVATAGTAGVAASSTMAVAFNDNGKGFIEGTVASIGANSLTVTSWGGIWTVDTASSTKVIEHYGHPAMLSDFQVGDTVRVDASVIAGSSWTVNAAIVHDLTLQYAFGTFHGKITAASGTSFAFQSVERGSLQVNLVPSTHIAVNGATSTASALTIGMTGTIFGNWDRANTNLTAAIVNVKSATSTANSTGQ